jgi:hypothetical protein
LMRRLAVSLESGVMLHRQAHLLGCHRLRSIGRAELRLPGIIRVSLIDAPL